MRGTTDTLEAQALPADGTAAEDTRSGILDVRPVRASNLTGEAQSARLALFYRALSEAPYRYDFFQALRRIEALTPGKPRIGRSLRPADDAVRLAQEPSLSFAPSTLSGFRPADARTTLPRMEVCFLGLLGPNGPLPLHLTEFARERLMHAGDATFSRFLDIFNHRFIALFYRAWAQSQPTASLDRPHEDQFANCVASLVGLGMPGVRDRDAVPDFAKLFYAGLLARHVRNADGLAALLSGFFRVPVTIEQFVGHWMTLPRRERTRVGVVAASLGAGALLGGRVWDRQHKFRIRLGPLTLRDYESFLPGGSALPRMLAWVRQYLGFELEWDLALMLARTGVPKARLGAYGRLGWTTWLGRGRPRDADVDDLKLSPEQLFRSKRVASNCVERPQVLTHQSTGIGQP
jgi:type VI secretion system protein ImpH